jgi:transcriptional regulator with XRE-family HTH domain
MSIAKNIKAWRQHLGLTQEQFADLAGIPRRTLVGYENEEREPGARSLVSIAKTGCNINWLLTGQGPRSLAETHVREADAIVDDLLSDPYLRWFLAQEGHWPRQINGLLGALRQMPLITLREGLAALAPGWRNLARSAFIDELSKRVAKLEQLQERVARLEAQVNPAPPAAAPASSSPWDSLI